ncbi:radical SAM protein [Methylocapsa polymorpha]|uniref:Radical SAM protein n=1 Tax=Methylocapsa polymorpha TaxID=3080828 RepID=A0ABZ0HMI2_9HYPH|nr:radical SAM protein [Methylocapsa sp. RX1]
MGHFAEGYIYVPPHIIARSEPLYHDGWIAFNSKTSTTFELTAAEYFLLEELQETGLPASDFSRIWPLVCGKDTAEERSALLLDGGVLHWSDNPIAGALRKKRTPRLRDDKSNSLAFLSSPTELELCITRRCNQTCFHCNVSAVSLKKREKSDTDFWINLLDQAEEQRVLRVTLTGGEPFSRRDFTEILTHISRKPFATILLTNGTLISDDQIGLIRGGSITLSVSIDGVDGQQHDSFRRSPGAFDATLRTLRRLNEAGIQFVISSVLHEGNVACATEFLTLANKVGAARLVVVPISAVGRAKSLGSSGQFPLRERMSNAITSLRRAAMETPGLDVIIGNPDPAVRELVTIKDRHSGATAMSKRNPGLCKAGVYSMAVDEDGSAYSCLRGLQERIYPIGNLKSQTLAEVWSTLGWNEFRDTNKPMVPCRVEEIGSRRRS